MMDKHAVHFTKTNVLLIFDILFKYFLGEEAGFLFRNFYQSNQQAQTPIQPTVAQVMDLSWLLDCNLPGIRPAGNLFRLRRGGVDGVRGGVGGFF